MGRPAQDAGWAGDVTRGGKRKRKATSGEHDGTRRNKHGTKILRKPTRCFFHSPQPRLALFQNKAKGTGSQGQLSQSTLILERKATIFPKLHRHEPQPNSKKPALNTCIFPVLVLHSLYFLLLRNYESTAHSRSFFICTLLLNFRVEGRGVKGELMRKEATAVPQLLSPF